MIASESQLAALAYALTDGKAQLTKAERAIVSEEVGFSAETLAAYRKQIHAGEDPLGEAFCALRSPEKRRGQGATYTPRSIVDAMVAWAVDETAKPVRIVDPGAGSGRFIFAAAKAFPDAELVAVEIDPLATIILRANAAVLKIADRLTVALADYRAFDLTRVDGPTLYIGNPPYVRHHDIKPVWKEWFGTTARSFGFPASGLAGLHVHFFLRTRQLARPGDFGAFITAAEWLDVNYGSVVRKMLADGLGGAALHVIDPKARPFTDALATGAITCFRVGNRPSQFTMRAVDSLDKLAPLSAGSAVEWSDIEAAPRWSALLRQAPLLREGEIELGELFRVHRGQVTGCNAIWIAGPEAEALPERFLFPSVTKARDLLSAGPNLDDATALRQVIDLPVDLDVLDPDERKAVRSFLKWARKMKADKGFIAQHRRAWWSVGLRAPAPILCTYMARRAPAFVRNHADARHLNIAHGLYPVQPLSEAALDDITRHLNETACMSSGRTYAGGLVKFEPGEVSRLRIPDVSSLGASA
ncbi:N-6 DNA methylase [Phyllobacterium sp. 0TCS1.6C]|uniref:Eco57I restriction-modification methylase domain-containing protein n=1 Tax=unclassified Phyllobacterium TaxID=2638441 RepID=UPI00226423CA|nr:MULTISPECIES: N-6 DNA methylase [unclassified Phyllobacterium]MCX8281769.1 N-6 DNA methylase [Phyllobacterium sp. 0TCS1.6C]MCX8295304.1 N-6 DNA methylase [Phyllobacterium sp. 0TCS1.6A]